VFKTCGEYSITLVFGTKLYALIKKKDVRISAYGSLDGNRCEAARKHEAEPDYHNSSCGQQFAISSQMMEVQTIDMECELLTHTQNWIELKARHLKQN
jgi:hypothetical protein